MLSGFRICCLALEYAVWITKLGCGISQAWGAHIQPRQTEKDINSPRATLVGFSNAIYLQQQHLSIKHTPLHAVKTSGHPSGRTPNSTSTKQVTILTILRVESYLKKASLVEVTVPSTSS